MKKFLIGLAILIVVGVGAIVLAAIRAGNSNPIAQEVVRGVTQPNLPTPGEITVGIFDPAEQPTELTKLLESRLKAAGFQTVIERELVDPQAATLERTTLLHRTLTKDKAEALQKNVFGNAPLRLGLNEAIQEDVVISVWNIEDVAWGELNERAQKFLEPAPETITVSVINASGVDGAAGDLAEALQQAGYVQVTAGNAETLSTEKQVIVYYQRNFKNAAKKIRELLLAQGYGNVSYRSALEQTTNLVIEIGQAASPAEPTAGGAE